MEGLKFEFLSRLFRDGVPSIRRLRRFSFEMRVVTACVVAGGVVFVAILFFLHHLYSIYALNPPPRLHADANRDGTVALTWNAPLFGPSTPRKWRYQCAKEGEQFRGWRKAAKRKTGGRLVVSSCGARKLKSGQQYKFRVRAVFESAGKDAGNVLGWPSNEARATPKSKVDPVVVWLKKLYKALNHTTGELAKILGENADASKQNLVDIKEILEKIEAAMREGKESAEEESATGGPTVAKSCNRKYFNDLYFGYGSWDFSKDGQSTDCSSCSRNKVTFANIVSGLEDSQGEILVEGYASPPGSYGYNLDLAHRRALYVIDRLLDQNEDWRARFKPVARGEGYLPDPARLDESYQVVRVSICSDEPQAPAASGQSAGRTAAVVTASGARRDITG